MLQSTHACVGRRGRWQSLLSCVKTMCNHMECMGACPCLCVSASSMAVRGTPLLCPMSVLLSCVLCLLASILISSWGLSRWWGQNSPLVSLSHLTPICPTCLPSVCPVVCWDAHGGADSVSLGPPPTLQPHRWYSGSPCRACRLRRGPRSPYGVSCPSPTPPWSGARAAWRCRLTGAGSLGSGAPRWSLY